MLDTVVEQTRSHFSEKIYFEHKMLSVLMVLFGIRGQETAAMVEMLIC